MSCARLFLTYAKCPTMQSSLNNLPTKEEKKVMPVSTHTVPQTTMSQFNVRVVCWF